MTDSLGPSTRVKICGLTTVEDAQCALDCGADALGLVFYDKSPRYVKLDQAKAIAEKAGPFVTVVGLFVNASTEQVQEALHHVAIDVLQFHGDEDEAFCSSFNKPYIKAVRMAEDIDPAASVKQYPTASGFLFDAWHPDKFGGTGETFDWQRLAGEVDYPLILAGGLTTENVATAVQTIKPYAVDVSGGVEQSPGRKCPEKIRQFVRNAKNGAIL